MESTFFREAIATSTMSSVGSRVVSFCICRPGQTSTLTSALSWWRALHIMNSNAMPATSRSEEHTSELQSRQYLVCRLLLEKKKPPTRIYQPTLQHRAEPSGRRTPKWLINRYTLSIPFTKRSYPYDTHQTQHHTTTISQQQL